MPSTLPSYHALSWWPFLYSHFLLGVPVRCNSYLHSVSPEITSQFQLLHPRKWWGRDYKRNLAFWCDQLYINTSNWLKTKCLITLTGPSKTFPGRPIYIQTLLHIVLFTNNLLICFLFLKKDFLDFISLFLSSSTVSVTFYLFVQN